MTRTVVCGTAAVLGSFGLLALVLAAIGIYGVTAYSVAQRTREIGIRMAIGARRGTVVSMVMRDALRVAGLGILAGLVAATLLTKVLATMLFGVGARDPMTFSAVAVAIATVAAAASLLPALRASRVEPLSAIRGE